MTARRRTLLLAYTLAMLAGRPHSVAGAQTPLACRPTETIEQCFTHMLDSTRRSDAGEVTAFESRLVREEAARATVGPQTADPDLGSAIRDFLPPIAAALLTPGLDADRAALSLRGNRRTPLGTLQLGADFPDPTIFAPLLEAAPEADRDALRERLEERLEDQDDVSGSISLNAENRWFGRSFRPHASYISDALSLLLPRLTRSESADLDDALMELANDSASVDLARRGAPGCTDNLSVTSRRLDCFNQDFRARVSARFRAAVAAVRARRARRVAALNALQLKTLGMLLNNQPQISATVTHRYRSDLVGPDQTTASLRFEVGRHNLNDLRRRCPRARVRLRDDERFMRCMRDELTGMGDTMADALARGSRFWLKVDVNHRAAYDFALPADGIALTDERSFELDGSLGYGQYFGTLVQGTRRPRVDAELSYQQQLEGELRNDRVVAKVSFTQPVFDELAVVVGAVWANRPEYVGEVERRVSTRLGLTYKLVQRE